ncbi:ATP-dependent zinc metalloprotease YME1L1-like isoform X1 [Branchiostoma lanceolatum]|uniref:ATP-dependent zinc metalloprotease YME1L1-like isoform X1 n=1 Tax=Branchiostoma lanceolatum TaxID=7740 RepID=UPI003451283A
MFSVSGLHPQLIAPLSQVVNVFNSLKSSTICHSSAWQRLQQKSRKEPSEFTVSDASVSQILKELGLSGIPPSVIAQQVNNLLPTAIAPLLERKPSHWQTSYVSAESFFENKNGMPPRLFESYTRRNTSSLLPAHISIQPSFPLSPVLQQTRGFKTRAQRSKLKMEEEEADGVLSGMKSTLAKDKPIDVNKIVKEHNIKEGNREAFKFGFADGYLMAQAQSLKGIDVNKLAASRVKGGGDQDAFKRGFEEGFLMSKEHVPKTTTWTSYFMRALGSTLVFTIIFVILINLIAMSFTSEMRGGTSSLSGRLRFSGMDTSVQAVKDNNVTFDDVKGCQEAKEELEEVVKFLQDPDRFTSLGGKLPKGVLLVGPPGTGKTLLARAVAGEADVPFFYASGSEFDEMFVGVGASRVRNLFAAAKKNAPCVVFLDELDSVGGKRVDSPVHPYSRMTINQLLAEMDGFKQNEGVIVMGATNFVEVLDPALTRPGRFDTTVTVPRPDVKGRLEILKLYLGKVKVDSDVDGDILARGTVGFTGADLENMVNQGALHAASVGHQFVTMSDLEFAKDKILMGPERRSAQIDDKNKKITAYHEGGHALVAYYTKDATPINKATIMPRGPTLGHVSLLPEKDQWNETKAQLLAQMDICMGGRVAEELIFGPDNITTGASSDFEQATKIAKMMVTRFGMSEKLGVMVASENGLSPEMKAMIETEVRNMLKESYKRAENLLRTHAWEHKTLAEALLRYETLTADEIGEVLDGKQLANR